MTDESSKHCEEGEEDCGPGGNVGGEQMVHMDSSLKEKVIFYTFFNVSLL